MRKEFPKCRFRFDIGKQTAERMKVGERQGNAIGLERVYKLGPFRVYEPDLRERPGSRCDASFDVIFRELSLSPRSFQIAS